MMSYSSNNKLLHHMSSVTHEVDQVLEVDFSYPLVKTTEMRSSSVTRTLDAYVCERDSFPGEMVWQN